VKAVWEVDAFGAKARLSQLPDLVERGEEIVITRHDKQVARLIPPRKAFEREQARAAIRRIRKRAEKLRLGPFEWAEWKPYRDEGRL
jgi:antitoxin (DNA-binding transcriptional repressor) of toxin-antitoxin stability system